MGRPKKHDERTAHALLEAAEALVEREGVDGVSVRRVADAVGTSTRAVYSLFGSKEGLLAALGIRAYELLAEGLNQLPITDDAAQDLVKAGAVVFRDFAINHPSMFRIGVQRAAGPRVEDAIHPIRTQARHGLEARVERLAQAGLLDGRTVPEVVIQFHALSEGLAAAELRGALPDGARTWHLALSALVTGLASPPSETASDRGDTTASPTAAAAP